MATSLTILPAAPSQPSAIYAPSPTNPRRPRLSLNTAQASQTRSVGKGASLRLDTLSAVSPTVRNTFSNAYETPAASHGRPSLKLNTSDNSTDANSYDQNNDSTYNSASSSASSTSSIATPPAYKLSHSIPSILTNSPYPSTRTRKMAARPFFPPVKRVSFREPLVEEIRNTNYTAKHSDLTASTSSESSESTAASSASSESTSTVAEGQAFANLNLKITPPPSAQATSPTSSVCSTDGKLSVIGKRDSSDSEGEDSCPETPIAGRRKRQRDWRWTLGPANKGPSSSSSSSEPTNASGSDDESV